MGSKNPYERAQEMQRRDQGKFQDNKERKAQKDAALRERARLHDDEREQQALRDGDEPDKQAPGRNGSDG